MDESLRAKILALDEEAKTKLFVAVQIRESKSAGNFVRRIFPILLLPAIALLIPDLGRLGNSDPVIASLFEWVQVVTPWLMFLVAIAVGLESWKWGQNVAHGKELERDLRNDFGIDAPQVSFDFAIEHLVTEKFIRALKGVR